MIYRSKNKCVCCVKKEKLKYNIFTRSKINCKIDFYIQKIDVKRKKVYLKMYNSVNRVVVKRIKYVYWVKKRLVWACLKGLTLSKTFKEESSHKNHDDDNYSASIFAMLALFRLIYLPH